MYILWNKLFDHDYFILLFYCIDLKKVSFSFTFLYSSNDTEKINNEIMKSTLLHILVYIHGEGGETAIKVSRIRFIQTAEIENRE